jgi:hypothetical protein
MRTSKAHSADGMRLSFSEVFGAQRSTAVNTDTDGRHSVTSQRAYKAVHQIPFLVLLSRFDLVDRGFHGMYVAGRHHRPVAPPAHRVLPAGQRR